MFHIDYDTTTPPTPNAKKMLTRLRFRAARRVAAIPESPAPVEEVLPPSSSVSSSPLQQLQCASMVDELQPLLHATLLRRFSPVAIASAAGEHGGARSSSALSAKQILAQLMRELTAVADDEDDDVRHHPSVLVRTKDSATAIAELQTLSELCHHVSQRLAAHEQQKQKQQHSNHVRAGDDAGLNLAPALTQFARRYVLLREQVRVAALQ